MDIEVKNINPRFVELFINTFAFTEEEFALFLSSFHSKTISKKDYYLKAGELCKSKAYLNKGCARNFVLDEKGHERILFLRLKIGGSVSKVTIRANREQTMYRCLRTLNYWSSRKKVSKLEMEILSRNNGILPNASFSKCLRNRIEEMKTLSAEERCLNLLEKQPHIFQRIFAIHRLLFKH
jgi:hypothetical protein